MYYQFEKKSFIYHDVQFNESNNKKDENNNKFFEFNYPSGVHINDNINQLFICDRHNVRVFNIFYDNNKIKVKILFIVQS